MRTIICIFALATASLNAEDWTVNGKNYNNVVVGKIEADRVHITYNDGVGTVALADLPPDLQKRFNYDPMKAKAAAADREKASADAQQEVTTDAQYQLAAAKYVSVNGRVVPRGIAGVETLKLDLIGEASANDSDGAALGHGSYCSGSVLWPGTDKWVPSGKMFILSATVPSGGLVTMEAVKLHPKNTDSQTPAAFVTEGKTTYALRKTVVQTEDGAVVYVPAYPITADQWRAAGSPQ